MAKIEVSPPHRNFRCLAAIGTSLSATPHGVCAKRRLIEAIHATARSYHPITQWSDLRRFFVYERNARICLADLADEPGIAGVNDPFAEYGAVSEDGTSGYATAS
jgi:hypothetical protein